MNPSPPTAPHTCAHCSKQLIEQKDNGDLEVTYTFDFAQCAASEGCLFFRWCVSEREVVDLYGETTTADQNQNGVETISDYIRIVAYKGAQDKLNVFRSGKLIKEAMCYTYNGNAAASLIKNRPINYTPHSSKSYDMAKKWIHSCDELIGTTPTAQKFPLPSRVIDVGTEQDSMLRLHLTDGSANNPYLCLSYSWGGDQTMKLVNDTLNSWSDGDGFSFNALPKTLQDAVTVTRRLGYRYLWVDSLCVLQDDVADKEKEIARMSTYFQGAAFTVMASRAAKSSDGFLQPREFESDIERKVLFTVKLWAPGTEKTPTNFRIGHLVMAFGWAQQASKEPAQSRGWMLQEQLISSRILEFGTQYTHWRCSAHSACEEIQDGGGESMSQPWNLPSLSDGKRITAMENFLYPTLSGPEVAWFYTVEDFTNRATTLRQDRIYAIAGIAERYSHYMECRYLAGLWIKSMPYALLWRIEYRTEQQPRAWELPTPTWSWMSIFGAVIYRLPTTDDLDSMIKLTTARINLKLESAKFGGTQNSQLIITGRPIRALLTDNGKAIAIYDEKILKNTNAEGKIISRTFWMDTSDIGRTTAANENTEVWMLPVLRNKSKDKDFKFCGLVLTPLGPYSQYAREGYFECWAKDTSEDIELLLQSPLGGITIY